MIRTSLTGSYSVEDVDRLVVDLQPLLSLTRRSRIEVDLADLTFLTPMTIAVLAAALARSLDLDLRTKDSVIRLPSNLDVRNYLKRMNLIQEALGSAMHEPFTRHPSVGFRECQHFLDEHHSAEASGQLADALAEVCAMDEVSHRAMKILLGELCDNVLHHADCASGGFAAAQGWRRRHTFQVAIADLGIGVRTSLTSNLEYADIATDVEAIEAALTLGVTANPAGNSGYGLAIAQALLAVNGGRLVVKSGTGEVWRGSDERSYVCDVDFPGTLVIVEARTDRPLDMQAIYDTLLGELES